MPHLLRSIIHALQRLGRPVAAGSRAVLGRVSWQPPDWMRRTTARFAAVCRSRPRSVAAVAVVSLAFTAGSIWAWNWYQRQPKPRMVQASVAPVPVTPLAKTLCFPPLRITFSESAARLDDLHQPTLRGVRLEPTLPGNWRWLNDRELTFQPTEDWPADREYRVRFEKSFFPRHVRMERHVYDFTTPPFGIRMTDCKLTDDAKEPGLQRVIAKIELTHAIEPGELEKHIALMTAAESRVFAADDQAPHFTIVYGLHNREAWIRSSPIVLPAQEDWLRVRVEKGVRTAQGGATSEIAAEEKALIPTRATAFAVESATADVVRNKQGEPEQLLHIATRGAISTAELARSIEAFLLPKKPAERERIADDTAEEETEENEDAASDDSEEEDERDETKPEPRWQSPAEITAEVLAQAKPVQLTALATDRAHDTLHHFRFNAESEGELYVRVAKGAKSAAGYELADDYTQIANVPTPPREIAIEGEGGVLALSGERKLSIRSRGVPLIKFDIHRVRADQINHLVSQTDGQFQAPEFFHSSFDESNISRIAREEQAVSVPNRFAPNYCAFDFSAHLAKPADGGSERGLFVVKGRGWDPEKKREIEEAYVSRFVLVTDLGLVVKKNADRSSDVFVVSIKDGQPIAGASVDLLGKNGIALQTATTSPDGRASFGPVTAPKSEREKKPVAYVARLGDDVSFIPYAREDRALNFSRFDIGGIENTRADELDAFLFTERGVYRPGDEMHIAIVVKQRNWQATPDGVPIEAEVIDARGRKVQTTKLSLPSSGFVELKHATSYESPTGEYTISAFLVADGKRSTLLGSTSVHVKEFLPDRMKIEARLSKESARGWVAPDAVRALIKLANLYGTPATDRRIKTRLELAPARFRFAQFPEHQFYDPQLDDKKERRHESVDLGEQNTDDAGAAEVDLQLERFADATYAMRFYAEGFEADGGRSVTAQASTLVSALPYVVGYKADGELDYIEANTPRHIELVAIDPQLNRIPLADVTAELIAQEHVSVLAKQANGNYAYDSVLKERVVRTEHIALGADGLRYALPTNEPGDYVLELRSDDNRRLNKLRFTVVGDASRTRSLARDAELQVKLERATYDTGEEIAISIVAPYAGSGLITIERDKVYAHGWFKTDSASSVQRIRVPDGLEGSAYINVAFVRALDSNEVFASPLSYAVVPFTANGEKRRLKVDLETAAVAKPGEPFRISYRTDRASKIVVFAVDEGILQVSDYELPDPLAHFFRKCALGVETSQIVDLIIPEFSLLRSTSAFGGDGEVKQLNPFKRVTDKPVVFWSGVVDAGPDAREIVYDVPDYFSGTLSVMAVAVADDAVGAAERDALIRGPFVITPGVPTLAAPGDEFEVGVTIANNVTGSGETAEVQLAVETSEHLHALTSATRTLVIPEGHEQTTSVRLRATDKLGSGEIRFRANIGDTASHLRSTVSVRPPTPFLTQVRSGSFKTQLDAPLTREMHPEFRQTTAAVSAVPLGLAHGLDAYLKAFPHGCSEQITSGALARLMLADEADFGLSRAEIAAQMEHTFAVLRRRQNDRGAFGYWAPVADDEISFVSVYVMHFLIEAKSTGFAPPAEMFADGMRYLRSVATSEASNANDARTIASAIYLLTREGTVTTNYIANVRDYLDRSQKDEWQREITGVYLAGALKVLHKDDEADELIGAYRLGERRPGGWNDFYQPLGSDAQYIAVIAREFPKRLKSLSAEELEHILRPIGTGDFSTLSAAYAVAALKAYSRAIAQQPPELTIAEVDEKKRVSQLARERKLFQRTAVRGSATAVRFHSTAMAAGAGAFYQVVEAGFDKHLPNETLTDGLEVYRELRDASGRPVTKTRLGEPIEVRLRVRSLRGQAVTNVAIIDLLPGGFEVVSGSLQPGTSTAGADYVDVREDRSVFYATVPTSAVEFRYQIKACSRGEFVVPPVFAESMYDRNTKARGLGAKISVTE